MSNQTYSSMMEPLWPIVLAATSFCAAAADVAPSAHIFSITLWAIHYRKGKRKGELDVNSS